MIDDYLIDYAVCLILCFISFLSQRWLTIRHFVWIFSIFTRAFLLRILVRYFLCCFWIIFVFCILFFENWFHSLLIEYSWN